jgi:hypothetical protein
VDALRSPPKGHLPDFVVIGALKSGTTSLDFYLDRHPQIRTAPGKEVRFFAEEEAWSRGVTWYRSHFRGQADIYGEVCATYASYPTYRDVARRMHSVIPDAKLIYLVRDPIERIVSQYVHRRADGHEDRSFETVVREAHEDDDYICRSAYYRQLARFLQYYPKSAILVVPSEDLLRDRPSTLRNVFRFLGVREDHDSPLYRLRLHQSARKRRLTPAGVRISRLPGFRSLEALPPALRWQIHRLLYWPFSRDVRRPALHAELRSRLAGFLGEDVEELRRFTGRDFAEWGIPLGVSRQSESGVQ